MEGADMGGPDMTAAELALGLLEGDARDAALRRLVRDPAFAADVEQWRDWLAALFADWPAVAPPAAVATRIEASLNRMHGGVAANDNGSRWRMLAVATSIAACLLLVVTAMLAMRPAPVPVRVPVAVAGPAPLIAAMAPTGKGTPVAAAYDATSGTVRIAGAVDVPAGRSAELWAIHGTNAPRSLGVVADATSAVLNVPASLRGAMAADTVLAISIEPAGGSPTGAPTGPVVAAGKLLG
ncbi:anti-sigma factor [Sphingomonas insulae]|uniref:Anti-sigma factor n=2 Tax=Sphingomonas insulae TaxID=424800 RepID=A0ABN1HLR5_9SPHN